MLVMKESNKEVKRFIFGIESLLQEAESLAQRCNSLYQNATVLCYYIDERIEVKLKSAEN